MDQDSRPGGKYLAANDRAQGASSRGVPACSGAYSGGDTILETRNLSRSVMGKVLVDNINVRVQFVHHRNGKAILKSALLTRTNKPAIVLKREFL